MVRFVHYSFLGYLYIFQRETTLGYSILTFLPPTSDGNISDSETVCLIYVEFSQICAIQSGEAHPSNRFDGEMIAHLNLFRVPMIDHRKRFDGEMIALLTGTLFR